MAIVTMHHLQAKLARGDACSASFTKVKEAKQAMDSNLAKLCKISGIQCWNINEIMFWLKLPLLPCEEIKVFISKKGEKAGQGIGRLEDGTIVVVEKAEEMIGKHVQASITNIRFASTLLREG